MAEITPAVSSSEPLVPFFKKRKGRTTTGRVRETSPTAGPSSSSATTAYEPASASDVILPTKKQQSSLFTQGSSKKRRKVGGHDDDDRETTIPDGPSVNWSSLGSKARIEAGIELAAEEAEEMEEELRRKRRRDENDGYDPDEDAKDSLSKDGNYRGQKGYQTLIRKKEEVPKAARVGPQKSNNTIRTVTLTDYQPDVCKDYKETGFCGFGDTCKFLHDRGTYLAGWQLDKLAEKASKQVPGNDDESSSDDEDIPWACFICRKPYTEPVVTRCSHYFCSKCAIKRFTKTPKCAACGQPTGGMFNRADKVIDKMKEKKEADEEGEAEEAGDDMPGAVKLEGLGNDGDQDSEDDASE